MSRQASHAAQAADLSLTERRNPRTADIDLATAVEIVDLMVAEDAQVPAAVATQRDAIARAIDIAVTTFREGGRLFYVGAGTSGRLGVLDASECPPTFGTDPEMVQGLIAGGLPALTRAQEGAEDREADGARDLDARGLTARDFVVGIAASAATPYVRGALARARVIGARTALVANSPPPEAVQRDVDVAIVPVVGPEVVTGSTRLKSGTATKLVLNMITTGAMTRLGYVYENLMVNVHMHNSKLIERGIGILMHACGVGREQAVEVIKSAGRSVPVALVMLKAGVDKPEAVRRLARAEGNVRRAIEDSVMNI